MERFPTWAGDFHLNKFDKWMQRRCRNLKEYRNDLNYSNLLEDLKRDEGFSSLPYRDTEGLLTIGYGTLIQNGISEEEAEFTFSLPCQETLRRNFWKPVPYIKDAPESVRNALGKYGI